MVSSIKARVVLFYMLVLFVILFVLGIFLYSSLSRIVYDSIDSSLLSKAKALATLVKDRGNDTEFNFSDEVMWEYNSPQSLSFFQIRHADGMILEKSESVGSLELPFSHYVDKTAFQTIHFKGKIVRMINFRVPAEEEHSKKEHGLIKPRPEHVFILLISLKDKRSVQLGQYDCIGFMQFPQNIRWGEPKT